MWVDPSATLGPGVILQAGANARIAIAAGVSIGMGTILQAFEGNIDVEREAVLGAGVLIVGNAKIGTRASVGATATIYNSGVKPLQVVPAGSVLGDRFSQAIVSPPEALPEDPQAVAQPDAPESPAPETPVPELSATPAATPSEETKSVAPEPASATAPVSTSEADSKGEPPKPGNPIYGQEHVSRILVTIFPNGQYINRPEQDK
ncbi:MAG TPA: transferase [Oscillatoriaceae cyanobacterium M33_DOE_052]|uniref:Transferase n=1 Tax=Planktothricoides sp. SpSt-374 TaxID=2282167 RepID=A0A7C3VQT6_9CYAN|nr:transferase [Oscillatoriaceae cyanobacterium M33_DOE_052]